MQYAYNFGSWFIGVLVESCSQVTHKTHKNGKCQRLLGDVFLETSL